jgi:hypothetical protein
MNVDDREFQKLLVGAIDREKQAYRRATYLTAIPVLIGLILFSFFTYRAIRLRREASSLDQQIQLKTRQLETIRRDEAELGKNYLKYRMSRKRAGWVGEGLPPAKAIRGEKQQKP